MQADHACCVPGGQPHAPAGSVPAPTTSPPAVPGSVLLPGGDDRLRVHHGTAVTHSRP
jgi:hypothetical protein